MNEGHRLLAYSFHSVKGGVGKSTLAVVTARALAAQQACPVILMDMDLTGTSLADVLELEAPRWPETDLGGALDLCAPRAATDFWDAAQTRAAIKHRQDQREAQNPSAGAAGAESGARPEPYLPRGVPFLNDFLLYSKRDWNDEREMPVDALLWKDPAAPGQLFVLPSSAIPGDLECILPLLFEEEWAAFVEGRLERLLEGLLERFGTLMLVVDTPPTLPGLSRTVTSLALRLGLEQKRPPAEGQDLPPLLPKRPLAEGQDLPPLLRDAEVRWQASLVATPDLQDLRAMARWLALVQGFEERVLRFVINRAPTEPGDRKRLLEVAGDTGDDVVDDHAANRLFQEPDWVSEDPQLQLFRGSAGAQGHSTSEPPAFLEEGLRWWREG